MICRLTKLMGVLWILLSFAACAHIATAPPSEEKLMQNVKKAWEAKVNKDWGTVYDMAAEAYKKSIKRDAFIQGSNIQIADFTIKEAKILPESGNKAQAVVDYTIIHMGFKFNNTARESWIWEGGEWRLAMNRGSAKSLFESHTPAK